MTCIAYDGHGRIAADTRVSTDSERRDNANKLHVFKDEVRFKGHRILVVGTSGNVKLSRKALQALKEDGDEFVKFYEKVSERHIELNKAFSLLIITDGASYIFTFSPKGTDLTQTKKGECAAIGSGQKIARFLMSSFNVPAQLAVAGASTIDPGTGPMVIYRDIIKKKVGIEKKLFYKNSTTIVKRLKAFIRKTQG